MLLAAIALHGVVPLEPARPEQVVLVVLVPLLGGALCEGGGRQPQCGECRRRSNRELPHDASLARAGRAWRVYRFSGTRKPKFSRNVVPSYSVRKMPRRCSSGTTRRQKSSNGLG